MDIFSPFCCMQYKKDATYLHGHKALDMVRRLRPRLNNVSFVETFSPGNLSKLNLYEIIAIKAVATIDEEEELYLSYDIECTFLMLCLVAIICYYYYYFEDHISVTYTIS